ncbi:MAG: phosphotransferase enzyme family protein [Paracoccaceae bacterium]
MHLPKSLTHLVPLAEAHLSLWGLSPNARVKPINLSENVTFLIEAEDDKAVLRLHRPGYHTPAAIESELAWMTALGHETHLAVPCPRPGRNGAVLQSGRVPDTGETRHMVLFEVIDGAAPSETDDLIPQFRTLGSMAATAHAHAETWQRPPGFERLSWDLDTIFGPNPIWGRWQDAPGVTPEHLRILAHTEERIRERLSQYGRAPDQFNLIHADMRLANLLISPNGTRLIDFDDCGFGWFLYDFAAAVSFIENDPRLPALKEAWLAGYAPIRDLSDVDLAEIDTFIMLRRLALLAWIGSHSEAPEPQALAPHFAAGTVALAKTWLNET